VKGAGKEAVLNLPSDQDASGRTLGEEEITLVAEALRSGTLTSTKGQFVKTLETEFAAAFGSRFAIACSSGSSAIHAAVAAIDPEPGEEIITSPITDMGAITPILYQGAIPVFADVDADTCNVTAESIEARVSERTRAVIVTHLFGQPCDMDGIMRMTWRRGLPVIEDCAQAPGARFRGRQVGTFGDLACYSLQQGKHMTAGEGGMVTSDDQHLARRIKLFVNKAWAYGEADADHGFLALNARMSELQGAVALAQLRKAGVSLERRVEAAQRLTSFLADTPGLRLPRVAANDVHAFWRSCVHVDSSAIRGGAVELGRLLRARGVAAAPRYIQKPAFQCEIFRQQRTFGRSRFPFTLARPQAVDYSPERFPGVFRALDDILVLPWNERFTNEHVDSLAAAIRRSIEQLMGVAA
jgi:dTDP-4-amino-4,6-dideoxygalactose transaminase